MVIMQQPPEMTVAYLFTEHLAGGPRLMEMILERGNMFKALKRVRGNKGAPGIDNMTVDQLPGYLKRHWLKIRESLLNGTYKPFPVKRKEIPKPDGGVLIPCYNGLRNAVFQNMQPVDFPLSPRERVIRNGPQPYIFRGSIQSLLS